MEDLRVRIVFDDRLPGDWIVGQSFEYQLALRPIAHTDTDRGRNPIPRQRRARAAFWCCQRGTCHGQRTSFDEGLATVGYEASCFYDSCPKDGLVSRWSLWDECATNLVGVVLGREAVAAG